MTGAHIHIERCYCKALQCADSDASSVVVRSLEWKSFVHYEPLALRGITQQVSEAKRIRDSLMVVLFEDRRCMRLWLALLPFMAHGHIASITLKATPTELVRMDAHLLTRPPLAAPIRSFTQLPAVWRCISWHESTWSTIAVNSTSQDEGAFQFNLATWREYAPVGFPLFPIQASLAQQYVVALRIYGSDGFHPWVTAPLCGV